MISEGCSVTVISFRYDHSHDQRYRTDAPATGCSATRISLASSSLSYPPNLSYQSKQFWQFLGVLYSISAILFFAFLVVAVYPYLFCFVMPQHVYGFFKWNHA